MYLQLDDSSIYRFFAQYFPIFLLLGRRRPVARQRTFFLTPLLYALAESVTGLTPWDENVSPFLSTFRR